MKGVNFIKLIKHINKENIVKIIVLSGIILLIIFIISYFINKQPYESSYFEKVGISRNIYLYSEMIEDFGNPNKVIVDNDGITKAVYNDLIMTFWSNSPEASLMNIRILDSKYKFGSKLIGVGSSKKDVLKAYVNVEPSPDNGYAYIDGGIWVEFFFEKGYVKEIMICRYV